MTTNHDPRPFLISRTFNAPRQLVWEAHTDCKHLKHWWGPKGCQIFSCKIDLRPGGMFLYGMRYQNGEMWGKFVYREIVAPERFVFVVSFSDENAGVTRHPLSATWPLQTLARSTFEEKDGKTTVTVQWEPYEATDEERRTFNEGHDSMTMGFTGTFDQLEAYLPRMG